ncbi:MAG TPA: GNAT family N-acetyltransferase [Candidatus Limnocylindrales bacterium]
MVARPPMILRIEPMRVDDLPAVHAIEKASFDAPWPPEAYRNDLETNRLAQYLVARIGDEIAAYGGMWLMVDEGHIITFAVHPTWRRQRIGERLLLAFLDLAPTEARTRPPSRSACRTCPPADCTRSSDSARSDCARAITATTARTR